MLKSLHDSQRTPTILALGVGLSGALLYSAYRLYKFLNRPPQPVPKFYLTHEEALHRFSQMTNNEIDYTICLKILPGSTYQGVMNLRFLAKYPLEDDIFLEFEGDSIEEIKICDQILPKIKGSYRYLWDGQRLRLPKNKLLGGLASVNISFSNTYSNTGTGLHSYIDHTDKRQYIYSHCEPDYMHKIFPCMDQPDLRAKFKLFLILPKEWVGVANEVLAWSGEYDQNLLVTKPAFLQVSTKEFLKGLSGKEHNLWEFNTTKPISTYLFSINVGPYCKLQCENTYKNIPMAFYCRESLYKHLKSQADEVLEITNLSMDFYEKFFQTPFPFSKYDQIFCPEYNSGAMENPGAVTINDTYIFRDKVTMESLVWRAVTVSHELSHMWFGDLVTMRWWCDLWLNESFADFFSYFCLSRIKMTKNLGDMTVAFNSSKGSAYRDDQMRTTHPIAGKINNTEETMNIFDGITYSKGSSVLKQLMFIIGEKTFSQALGVYFKKHAWSNASLEDFIGVLNEEYKKTGADGIKLEDWTHEWLNTAGLNECTSSWDPSKKSNKETVTLVQSPALKEFPTLRNHKLKLAFFNSKGQIAEVKEVVLVNKEETKVEYDGSAGYQAILVNYEDHAYLKLVLDSHSIEFFKENLKHVDHSLSRSMIWRSFYDMVRDGKLSSYEYTEIFERNAPFETEINILNDIFTYARMNLSWTPISSKSLLSQKLFGTTYKMLLTEKNEERINILQNFLISFAHDEHDVEVLYRWLKGESKELKHLEISVYNAWDIIKEIYKSSRYSLEEKQKLFNEQSQKDPESALSNEKIFKALLANEQERKLLWESYLNEKNPDSVQRIADSMEGFNDEGYKGTTYHDLYFNELINVSRKRTPEFARSFSHRLFPNSDDFVYLKRKIEEVLALTKESDITLRKFLGEQMDITDRRMKACERFMNYSKLLKKE